MRNRTARPGVAGPLGGSHRQCIRPNRRPHEGRPGTEDQSPAVGRPPGQIATVRGHDRAAPVGNPLQVDVPSSALVRLIRHDSPIGREGRGGLVEGGLDDRARRSAASGDDPHVTLRGLGGNDERECPAVPAHRGWECMMRNDRHRRHAAAVHIDRGELERGRGPSRDEQPPSVGRPHRRRVDAVVRQSGRRAAIEVDDADVGAGAVGRTRPGEPAAVRGQRDQPGDLPR